MEPISIKSILRTWRDNHLRSYKHVSYSQEGEDRVLERLMEGEKNGFYVDVGAHHPRRFSNTYLFYKRGWRGVNIDARTGMKKLFEQQRPGDQSFETAISRDGRMLKFFRFHEAAVSTFSQANADWALGKGYALAGTETIPTKTLAAVLGTAFIPGKISFLTIDVEGMDLEVLEGNDWSRYRPKVVAVETFGDDLAEALSGDVAKYVAQQGYVAVAKTVNTLFLKEAS